MEIFNSEMVAVVFKVFYFHIDFNNNIFEWNAATFPLLRNQMTFLPLFSLFRGVVVDDVFGRFDRALRGAVSFRSARAARAGSDILRGLRAPEPPAIFRFAQNRATPGAHSGEIVQTRNVKRSISPCQVETPGTGMDEFRKADTIGLTGRSRSASSLLVSAMNLSSFVLPLCPLCLCG